MTKQWRILFQEFFSYQKTHSFQDKNNNYYYLNYFINKYMWRYFPRSAILLKDVVTFYCAMKIYGTDQYLLLSPFWMIHSGLGTKTVATKFLRFIPKSKKLTLLQYYIYYKFFAINLLIVLIMAMYYIHRLKGNSINERRL